MENCLLGLKSKQLYLDEEMHRSLSELQKCDIRKAYFHRQGSKYVVNSERLLNLCLQCEERSQRRWFGTKGEDFFSCL